MLIKIYFLIYIELIYIVSLCNSQNKTDNTIFLQNITNSLFNNNETTTSKQTVNTKYCKSGEHVIGKWVEKNITKKSFLCCGWDKMNEEYMNNNTVCLEESATPPHGQGQCLNYRFGHNNKMLHSGGHSCFWY